MANNNEITPEQALQLLDQIVSGLNFNRATHLDVMNAVSMLQTAIAENQQLKNENRTLKTLLKPAESNGAKKSEAKNGSKEKALE